MLTEKRDSRFEAAMEQGRADRRKHGFMALCPFGEGTPEHDAWYEGWLEELHSPVRLVPTFRSERDRIGLMAARANNPHPEDSLAAARYDWDAEDWFEEKD